MLLNFLRRIREIRREREEARKREEELLQWRRLLYLANKHREEELRGFGYIEEAPISWGDQ